MTESLLLDWLDELPKGLFGAGRMVGCTNPATGWFAVKENQDPPRIVAGRRINDTDDGPLQICSVVANQKIETACYDHESNTTDHDTENHIFQNIDVVAQKLLQLLLTPKPSFYKACFKTLNTA